MWINWCFDTDHDFCDQSYILTYDDFKIEIKRGNGLCAHNIFIETTMKKHNSAYEAVLGFLSELTWLFQTKAELLPAWTRSGSKGKGWQQEGWFKRVLNVIDLSYYRQVAVNKTHKLSLGLYREGITSNSSFYSYLSYFKIIMMHYPTKQKSSEWINKNISNIHKRTDILNRLSNQKVKNIGEYLYISGRCALAHCDLNRMAKGDPVVDPNNYDDNMRISGELPLIKEFAETFIIQELKIPTWLQALKQWKAVIKEKLK